MIPVKVLRAHGFTVEKAKTSPGNTCIARETPFSYYKENEVKDASDIYDSKLRDHEGKPRHEVLVRHDYTLTEDAEVPITIVSRKEKAVLVDLANAFEQAQAAADAAKKTFIDRVYRRHQQAEATANASAGTPAATTANDDDAAAAARAERIMEECGN